MRSPLDVEHSGQYGATRPAVARRDCATTVAPVRAIGVGGAAAGEESAVGAREAAARVARGPGSRDTKVPSRNVERRHAGDRPWSAFAADAAVLRVPSFELEQAAERDGSAQNGKAGEANERMSWLLDACKGYADDGLRITTFWLYLRIDACRQIAAQIDSRRAPASAPLLSAEPSKANSMLLMSEEERRSAEENILEARRAKAERVRDAEKNPFAQRRASRIGGKTFDIAAVRALAAAAKVDGKYVEEKVRDGVRRQDRARARARHRVPLDGRALVPAPPRSHRRDPAPRERSDPRRRLRAPRGHRRRRHRRGRRARSPRASAASCRSSPRACACSPRRCARSPEKWHGLHGRRDALSPALRRSHREPGGRRRVPRAHARSCARSREFLDDARLPRGRDADDAHAHRRRRGEARS